MEVRWIKLGSVTSTNSYISELIKQGKAGEGLVVIADYQEAGRGQGANRWQSRKGENLLMSTLLFPAFLSASRQFHISRMASLAICDTMDPLGLDPRIKWPNDILIRQEKIAGILIEHGITGKNISHTIIGIGMNLNQSDFPEFPVNATSLALEKGFTREPLLVAEDLLKHLMARYIQLKEGRSELLEQEYLERLFRIHRPASFRAKGKTFNGVIRGVNDYGELLVEQGDQTVSYGFQEIELTLEG
ncbi:MAG: biotin--[acetyl-CoA-carboxylase] ligase [Bacteroidales bacterium]|nr:biotin--[acetyl-CoA-carboxylase] ligase [Bacteroidales bacterium]